MANQKHSPLQSGFLLTEQEKRYILIISAVFLLGLVARYWYVQHEKPTEYTPDGIEKVEHRHE